MLLRLLHSWTGEGTRKSIVIFKTRNQTYLRGFVGEGVKEEGVEELIGILNAVRVFTDDPNHAGFSLGFVQGLQTLAQRSNHLLIPMIEGGGEGRREGREWVGLRRQVASFYCLR